MLRPSEALSHPKFPGATVRGPLLISTTLDQRAEFRREMFGPISFLVAVPDIDAAIDEAADGARDKGAVTAAIYSTDRNVTGLMETAMIEAGVALSENLHGGTYVNQSAAYSDYHVTGANPAGNASLTDEAFVTSRFRVVQRRLPLVT